MQEDTKRAADWNDVSITQLARLASSNNLEMIKNRDDLYKMIHEHLVWMARKRLSRRSRSAGLDSEFLASEAFLRIVTSCASEWENRRKFFQHIATTMENLVKDAVKAKRNQTQQLSNQGALQIVDNHNHVQSLAEYEEYVTVLNKAIAELGEDDQIIVRLSYFGRFPYRVIGCVLDMPVSTVGHQLKNVILPKLRSKLTEYQLDEDNFTDIGDGDY